MVKRKTLVSILISLLLCVGLLPLKALASPAGEWTDYVADSFASGTGTKEDPYIINSPEQLAKLAKDINSGIEIKNVIIKDGYIKTEAIPNSSDDIVDAAGLLIGSAAQGYGLSTTVSNCHVSGTIESNSALTGGLAGYNRWYL